ncbi:uncharacterized protein LY89DRAFT_781649 [Mollisia scopiformis]|uniref:Uncharacterized protein n=1 Tax=Mollisia scopiformis TaxID=149040 RepID=A0A194XBB7_MOLSC|nr:uncharacterized protein LY89DRAFT_781649 [Mollisia scopiformis]KUJ17444.1 hypothetical protein LY89DRAFT_781649 [Mollisia scopiformis]
MSTVPILFSFPSAASSEQRGIATSTASSALSEATLPNFVTVTITALSSHSTSIIALNTQTPTPSLSAYNSTSNSTSAASVYKDNKFSGADWATTIVIGLGGIILCCMIPIVIAVYWKDWQAKRRERWGESSEDF